MSKRVQVEITECLILDWKKACRFQDESYFISFVQDKHIKKYTKIILPIE